MRLSYLMGVNYGQVTVRLGHLDHVGLLWTDDHVAQGFAWDDGIVAFGVPDHDGECLLEVDTERGSDAVGEAALWAVEVPFVASEPAIAVGTVLAEHPVSIAVGTYRLLFEAAPGATVVGVDCAYRLSLGFVRSGATGFAVRRRGPLGADRVLRERAVRAPG